jgi:hypothetical protein
MNTQSATSTPARPGEFPQSCDPVEGRPAEDLVSHLRQYARQKPDVAALWCFGIGFVLGWKLRPW